MIFTTIEGDAGTRITTTMQARKVAQQQATEQLNTDIQCLKEYEQVCKAGEVTSEDFARTMGGASENAQKYAKNIKDGTGSSKIYAETQGKVQGSLKKTSVASKIATASVKAFNIVLSTLASFAVSFVISKLIGWIYDIANASEKAKEKAQELGEEFKNTKKEIEDYKTEIKELYTTLNDSSSSIEEVANARKTLMSVQDELIEKFGDEEGAINNITKAINGQIDALDKLTQSEWKEKLNKFNSENRLAYNTWDYMYNNNTEKMLDVMSDNPESTISFSYLGNEDTKSFLEKLQKAGYIDSVEFGENIISLDGEDLKEVYDNLLELQTFAKDNDATDNILNKINKVATNMKDTIDKYGEMYDQYVLYEEILPDEEASGYFDSINEAYKDYQDAVKSGNNDAITKAMDNYADVMGNALDNSSGRVKQYFEDMYPDLQKIVGQWQFEVDFNAKDGTLDDDINKFLSDFDTEGDGVVADELLHLDKSSDAYKTLKEYADSYNLSIEQLIEKLEALGLIKSTAYAEFEKLFGEKEGFKDLTDEELKLAYSIENVGDMTFDEVKSEIEWLKKQASKETVVDVRLNMISDLNDMSEGFEELDKIYASIKDKDPFDFKLLDEKDFKENFSDLPSYSDFIETVTGNPDNINACQEAFNKLLTDWIYSEGILKNVTEENAALTESMLKQMGVANAHDIVMQSLSGEYGKLSYTAEELAKAEKHVEENTIDTTKSSKNAIATFISEAEAAGIAKDALYQVIVQENVFKNNKLSATDKIREISKIASAYGVLADSIMSSVNAEMNRELYLDMQNGGKYQEQIKNAYVNYAYDQYSAEIAKKLNSIQTDYTGGSTSNKETENSKETFDWIETKLKRVQRTITNLGKTVSATWKSWTKRNNALSEQISEINKEIDIQNQGKAYYEAKANSVGLPSEYQELVKNGGIRIDEISDETIKEKIQEFQEWYEKALACEDAIQDLNDELANLAKQNFDNIIKQYDNRLSIIEHETNMLDSQIEMMESQGNIASSSLYKSLIKNADEQLSLLQSKYVDLENAMSGVEKGTEMWYDMYSELLSINEEMADLNNQTIEWANTIRDLDWEKFDALLDRMNRIKSEVEFLIEYLSYEDMFNDDGTFTKEGQATLGLHFQNYNNLTEQAKELKDEIAALDAEYANDKNDINYYERRNELEDQYWDTLLSVKDTEQTILDMQKEQYDTFLDYLNEMIEKRKKILSQAKEQADYEKTVTEQAKEVAKLEKQLIAYQGDDSEESRSTVQKIKVSLEEAKENLEQTQYEKYLSDQEKMYDELYSETEDWINDRLDQEDLLLSELRGSVDKNSVEIGDTIGNLGVTISDTMTTILGEDSTLTSTIVGIKDILDKMYGNTDVPKVDVSGTGSGAGNSQSPVESVPVTSITANNTTNTPSATTQQPSREISVGGKINASGAQIYDYAGDTTGERQYYRNDPIYTVLEERNGYVRVRHHSQSKGTTGWFKKSDIKAYKTGGLVDETGLAWLDGTKGKPEMVLSAKDTENFIALKDTLSTVARTNMFEAISGYTKVPNLTPVGATKTITNHNTFEFNLPNVKDTNEFITDLQHSKRFENIVLEITDGNNNFSKYKY